MSPPAPDRRALAWMVAAAFLYSGMSALVHSLGPGVGWRLVMLGRAGLGAALALAWLRAAGARPVFRGPRALWVRSLAGAAVQVCTFYALMTLPATDVVTLRNTYPIFVGMLAGLAGWRRPGARLWAAVACGVAGVVLLERPRLATLDLPVFAMLGSSGLVAVAMLALARLGAVDARAVTAHFSLVSAAVALAACLAVPGELARLPGLPPRTLATLGAVAVAGCLAQVAMSRAYARGSPVEVSVAGLTQVLFAAGFDLAAGTRALGPAEVAGAALILAPGFWMARPAPAAGKGAA